MKKQICIFCVMAILLVSVVIFAAPGTDEDPLVSLSYLNESISQVRTYVDQKIAGIGSGDANGSLTPASTGDKFTVISVSAGERLICGEGTELILRQGTGTIIATDKGGLANVTAGADLKNGVAIPANSLLIVPLADGRGLSASSDMLVMIKGAYTIANQ